MTIEELIAKLKADGDTDSAGVVEKLVADHDNFKSQSRRWEDQAKQNKDDAEAKRTAEARVAELESAQSKDQDRIKELETKVTGFEQQQTRAQLVTEVASAKSIPSKLHGYLRGDTKEELEASADQLKQDFKIGQVDDFGSDNTPPKGGTLEDGKQIYENYNKK